MMDTNLDPKVVAGFGDEWQRFDQSALSDAERRAVFESYFAIFPWAALPEQAIGFDLGCGSGRWAALVAPRVGRLHCIDASAAALAVARRTLAEQPNCVLHHASVDALPLEDAAADFGYSLGVLHHIPDTQAGINACVARLKPGAPFLIYLYYAFDNRPWWFRALWQASNLARIVISRLPHGLRYVISQLLAGTLYWPLARLAGLGERLGLNVEHWPLAAYRQRSWYVMRNDALDRFGTRLERRFTRAEIAAMLHAAGLRDISFSPAVPYWCALGYKA
jgi:SAM-dependent methyltransferase